MISPMTPPGTRVAFTERPRSSTGFPPDIDYRAIYTLAGIEPSPLSGCVFVATLEEVGDDDLFTLDILRIAVLPSCLTSLLHTAPTDLERV